MRASVCRSTPTTHHPGFNSLPRSLVLNKKGSFIWMKEPSATILLAGTISLVVDDRDLHVDVAAGCVGVGAYLVCRIRKFLRLIQRDVRDGNFKNDGELEPAVIVGTDGNASAHGGIGGVCLGLTRNQFQCRVEACGVTEREELFGVCAIARATHFFGYGHFEVDAAVGKVCLAVARVADGECFCGVEGFHRAFLSCFLNEHRLSYVRLHHPRAAFDRSVTHEFCPAEVHTPGYFHDSSPITMLPLLHICNKGSIDSWFKPTLPRFTISLRRLACLHGHSDECLRMLHEASLGTVFVLQPTVPSLRGQAKSRRRVLPDTCQQGTNEKTVPMAYLRYRPLFTLRFNLNTSYPASGSEPLVNSPSYSPANFITSIQLTRYYTQFFPFQDFPRASSKITGFKNC